MILKLAYPESDAENDPYWNDMRNHDYSASFPAVKDFIQQNSPRVRDGHRRRNRMVWVFAVLLPFLIFFSCKREVYREPQDTTLRFIAKDSAQLPIEFAIQRYADKKWKAVFQSHAGTVQGTIYAPAGQYNRLQEFSEKLKIIPGLAEIYITEISTTIKESRLSRLSYQVFNQHINAASSSPEELSAEIVRKLREKGIDNLMVQLQKEKKSLQMELQVKGNSHGFSFDLNLPDGTKVSAVGEKLE